MSKTYKCSQVKNSCYYSIRLNGGNIVICDYLHKTGERRGCNPEKCEKYIHKSKGEKKTID